MITIFKIFENKKTLKVGDIVKHISKSVNDDILRTNELFKIEYIKKFNKITQYKLFNLNGEWNSKRFILATPEEIIKYNIEEDKLKLINKARKFNI